VYLYRRRYQVPPHELAPPTMLAPAPIADASCSPSPLVVFPMGAQLWEIAADHLDRLPGKSLIDRFVHE
jgi:hypothetical protein